MPLTYFVCSSGKMSASLFQCAVPMHNCQGIMPHLTNDTFEELNEDGVIDIEEDDSDNNSFYNNTNEDTNEDDESIDS